MDKRLLKLLKAVHVTKPGIYFKELAPFIQSNRSMGHGKQALWRIWYLNYCNITINYSLPLYL